MTFALLNDPANDVQLMIRNEHVSAVEINKDDQAVTVYLLGGQALHLNPEQAKQFVQHIKAHMHTTHSP